MVELVMVRRLLASKARACLVARALLRSQDCGLNLGCSRLVAFCYEPSKPSRGERTGPATQICRILAGVYSQV